VTFSCFRTGTRGVCVICFELILKIKCQLIYVFVYILFPRFSIADSMKMKRESNDGDGPQDQKRNRRNEETVRILIPSSVST